MQPDNREVCSSVLGARRAQYFVSILKAFAWNLVSLQSTLIERHRTHGKRVQGKRETEKAMSTYSMGIYVLKQYVVGARI
jgi:hypothetical protein